MPSGTDNEEEISLSCLLWPAKPLLNSEFKG